MCRFAEICAGISLKVSENLKAYILQAIAANEGTDCRFVLNAKEIERFSVAMHMKISLRAAFAYLLTCIFPTYFLSQVQHESPYGMVAVGTIVDGLSELPQAIHQFT